MDIIGHGFLSRNLQRIAEKHPHVVVLAAGPSTTLGVAGTPYQREAMLVYDTIGRCRRQGRTLVFFSTASASMYGSPECSGREDEAVFPSTPYGRHKLSLETVVRLSGVRHLILRLGYTAGPYQPVHQLLPSLACQVRAGAVEVRRGSWRDLIDVADVVTIIDELFQAGIEQQVVNVASGVSVPVECIVDHLEARLGVLAERKYIDQVTPYSVSLEKLRGLVPAVAGMGFGPDYYRTVIDRYLENLALLK